MDHVVKEINGLEVVKKRIKTYIFRFSFKSSLTGYILIFKTLDHIYECPHNGQF